MDKLMTTKDVVEYTGVTSATLYNWRRAGRLKPLPGILPTLRYERSEVDRCLRERKGAAK